MFKITEVTNVTFVSYFVKVGIYCCIKPIIFIKKTKCSKNR